MCHWPFRVHDFVIVIGSVAMVAKVGRRVQILYSPRHMSLTSQAHVDAHAAALLLLSPNRLSTSQLHFVDGFLQICQGFMGVYAFRHSRSGVAEYHLDGRLIGSCPVKHGGQRVAALMGRVVHVQLFHGMVKEAAEGFVVVAGADSSFCFSLRQQGQDFLVDGDFPNPRQRLALLDVDILLAEVHITGGQGNVFSGSHAGVNQDEHVFHAFHCFDGFP